MHPVAFKIGNFAIYYYGLMMVVAYIVTLILMRFNLKYEDIDMDTAIDITIYAIIGGVTGTRVVYVLLNLKDYMERPLAIFNVREGGLSWHGAFIGGAIALYILSKVKKMPVGKLADFAGVHSTISLAIGRIGCFLNGCCYGKVCDLPWAVEFSGAHIEGHRHPTQIYESLMLVVLYFILLKNWKKKKFHWEMFLELLVGYGVIRFIVEIFRHNTTDQYLFGLNFSLAQYMSILMIIVFSAIIVIKRKKAAAEEKKLGKEPSKK